MRLKRWFVVAMLTATPGTVRGAGPSPESPVLSPARFERVVIDDAFPGAYQVEVADVNGDKKPDVVALGGSTLAWYENPSWKKRVVSTAKETPDIISSATADLDGDGKAEIAIAYDFSMNEPKRGKLLLAIQGAKADDPWTFRPIVDAGRLPTGGGFAGGGIAGPPGLPQEPARPSLVDVPSIHRLRWGWFLGKPIIEAGSVRFEKGLDLVVAPIFGPSARPPIFDQEPAHLFFFNTGADPKSGRWTRAAIGEAPVLHAIDVVELDGSPAILGASNRGVTLFGHGAIIPGPLFQAVALAPGAPGDAPKKGASEVHLGRLKDGRRFLATVEPWHGTDVAIYPSESVKPLKFGPRTVIDSSLKEGHALWVADVDGDGDDEVFAGYRGPGTSVLMYDFDGRAWGRTVVDDAIAAQDLRGGDLDGDGTPDVVAVGGKTHNVVWYRPIRAAK